MRKILEIANPEHPLEFVLSIESPLAQPFDLSGFAEPQTWFLAKGGPPALRDPRRSVRMLRAAMLLGLLGGCSAASCSITNILERFLSSGDLFLLSPAVVFALIVLVPVSRWRGRGWISSLLSVPVSMAALYAAIFVEISLTGAFSGRGSENTVSAGFAAGATGAAIVSLWMTAWKRPPVLTLVPVTTLAGALGGMIMWLGPENGLDLGLPVIQPVLDFARPAAFFAPFHTLVAISLALRWWPPPSMHS